MKRIFLYMLFTGPFVLTLLTITTLFTWQYWVLNACFFLAPFVFNLIDLILDEPKKE